jgi:ABC-type glycerol-3-phosphate transport system permease component
MKISYRTKKSINTTAYYLLIVLLIGFFLAPHLWLITAAFDPKPKTYLKVFRPTLANFISVFEEHNANLYLKNTAIIAGLSTVFTVILTVLAGYALSRLKVREIWIVVLWLTTTIPVIAFLVPYYKLFRSMGLLNTYLGCVIVFTVGNIPYFSWLMKNFFDTFPKDLEEAAIIDGASRMQMLFKVVIPLSLPPIGLIAAMAFNGAWGDLLAPMVLLNKAEVMPISVGMLVESQPKVSWGFPWELSVVAPFSILYTLPPALLFVYMQKYMKGLARIT